MTPEEQAVGQTTSRGAPRSPRKKHRPSLLGYLVVLFFAAFMLLLLSYFMQQRRNDQDVINGLQESISAMQSVDTLREENQELTQELRSLQAQLESAIRERDLEREENSAALADLTRQERELAEENERLKNTALALDWLWRIQREYSQGRRTNARNLIQTFREAQLEGFLPAESMSDPEYRSPLEQYTALCKALGVS